ncbi:hypothetical protein [Phaeocystidibacter luteus]|uniref:VCBS repeat-containing protein n=1 Tax=Phaeocystidibacter luteus TaxID=911197 RepID=A0A6N6REU2_9FLAO|nr:hypothetical protein [Phaeocystidibacter luteus]KAB2807338.1 hypothetical protein F8C67_12225 [Phaeocystidibacter luteus]
MKLFVALTFALTSVSSFSQPFWDTTFVVDNVEFTVFCGMSDSGSYAYLASSEGDTLIISGAAGGIDIFNFDEDGYVDITFSYLGNYRVADLYLYDKGSKSYRRVVGFEEVSDAQRFSEKRGYYYDYQTRGCADFNWKSTLFYIEDFRVISVAEIEFTGCPQSEKERKLEVYSAPKSDERILLESENLPEDMFNNKWDFIRDYWKENWRSFVEE